MWSATWIIICILAIAIIGLLIFMLIKQNRTQAVLAIADCGEIPKSILQNHDKKAILFNRKFPYPPILILTCPDYVVKRVDVDRFWIAKRREDVQTPELIAWVATCRP